MFLGGICVLHYISSNTTFFLFNGKAQYTSSVSTLEQDYQAQIYDLIR
jgi:hypothetical protein